MRRSRTPNSRLILNERYKNDPHMQRLVEQFEILEPSLSGGHDDGPDSVEGGHWIINNKLSIFAVKAGATRRSAKKY